MERKKLVLWLALLAAGLAAFLFFSQNRDAMPDEDRLNKMLPVFIGTFVAVFAAVFLAIRSHENRESSLNDRHGPPFMPHTRKGAPLMIAIIVALLSLGIFLFYIFSRTGSDFQTGQIAKFVVLAALLLLGVVMFIVIKALNKGRSNSNTYGKNARQILDERYARGEITDSEYRTKLEELNRLKR